MATKLEKDIVALSQLKNQSKELDSSIEALQARVVKEMIKTQIKTVEIDTGEDTKIRATLVVAETTSFNEAGLKKTLGATNWKKVIKEVFDKKKLEALIAIGDVKAIDVAKHTVKTQNEPYIKLTN